MIAIQSIEDILDADRAKRTLGLEPLLTDRGHDFFTRLVREMKKLRLTQATKDLLEDI